MATKLETCFIDVTPFTSGKLGNAPPLTHDGARHTPYHNPLFKVSIIKTCAFADIKFWCKTTILRAASENSGPRDSDAATKFCSTCSTYMGKMHNILLAKLVANGLFRVDEGKRFFRWKIILPSITFLSRPLEN
ncbi:hypothetical protein CDAR_237791 [Caerostris darwini]|uniref:Uncharacterized protein n=1 Tax=Caerostris darwini TaxID=1538125 RepID=A0AAV4S6R5_9ARAC|nr:hypothetical protein CDAR_237791 [Caerostris darwini]